MSKLDLTMKLTIRVESSSDVIESTYVCPQGKLSGELFWNWFVNVWPALGLDNVKKGIEENDR